MADEIDISAWQRIASPRGLWHEQGVVALRRGTTGRTYVIAGTEVGKRLGHAIYLLDRGVHHNAPLQQDWADHRDEFERFVVQRCPVPGTLSVLKQFWMDWTATLEGGTYNARRSTPRRPRRRRTTFPSWAYDPPPDAELRRLLANVRAVLEEGDQFLAHIRSMDGGPA